MKKLVPFIILVVASFVCNSQTWEKLFSGKSTDVFRSIKEVPAGGYIAAGYTPTPPLTTLMHLS
jgi:hypothetical protein